ncbi:MAG: hypothetical protein LBE78_08935 [Burkholderiaceae bacterium]|nr:hypothetical protein [Burkholderiaceae bacterium]
MIHCLFFAPANRADLMVKFPRFDADRRVIDLPEATAQGVGARDFEAGIVDQSRLKRPSAVQQAATWSAA